MSWGLEDVGGSWKTDFDKKGTCSLSNCLYCGGHSGPCSKQHGRLLNISEKNRPPPPLDANEKIGKIQTGILPSLSLSTPSVYGRDHSCLMFSLQNVLECMLYTAIHGKVWAMTCYDYESWECHPLYMGLPKK